MLYTALDAQSAGFTPVLIGDACRAIDLNGSLKRAMDELDACKIPVIDSERFQ